MLGDFDAAVLTDSQNTVVVQQGLGAGFLVRFDDIFEQYSFLDFGRNGLLKARMGDVYLPLHSRKDADVNLIFGSICPGNGSSEEQRCTSDRH